MILEFFAVPSDSVAGSIGYKLPMTDPWCCYIWCSMDPIKINPSHVSINIPAPAGSVKGYELLWLSVTIPMGDPPNTHRSFKQFVEKEPLQFSKAMVLYVVQRMPHFYYPFFRGMVVYTCSYQP